MLGSENMNDVKNMAFTVEQTTSNKIKEGTISLGFIKANINGLVRAFKEEEFLKEKKKELWTLTFKKGIMNWDEMERKIE